LPFNDKDAAPGRNFQVSASPGTISTPRVAGPPLKLFAAGLALAALGGAAIALTRPLAALVPERIYALFTIFLGILIEALPFLLIGVVASAALQALISAEQLQRWAPKGRVLGPLAGGTLGMVFPVCECGGVPVTRRLLTKGAPVPAAVAFLLASSVVNPVVLISTTVAFGDVRIALARAGGVLAVAVLVGVVFSFHSRPASLLAAFPSAPLRQPDGGRSPSAGQVVLGAGNEFFEMLRYLVLGALLASTLQVLVPRSALLSVGQGPISSVAALMGLAALLSICSVVDAFVALSFVSTFTSGSILAFLVFGPMIDIKSILMFLSVLKRGSVAIIVLLAAQAVLLLGVFVNLNLGG
jgi:uncharacterized membrane protein YraQ (UPF0718 family)